MKTKNFISESGLSKLYFLATSAIFFFVLAFGWGFISVEKQIFPYKPVKKLWESAKGLKHLCKIKISPRSSHSIISETKESGVLIHEKSRSTNDLVFITLFDGNCFSARLIDHSGNVLHEWLPPYETLKLNKDMTTGISLNMRNLYIHGATLFPNGDILIVIENHGLVKLDKNSNAKWILRKAIHHALDVAEDGSIWTLDHEKVPESDCKIPLINSSYTDDLITKISPDGKVVFQRSIVDIILDNKYEGILYGGQPGRLKMIHNDPLHTNDIEVLTAEDARLFPNVDAGDIMLSMRTVNTVIIVDQNTFAIKWSMTGPFHRQHDPQITKDGNLLVFDNRTSYGQRGSGAKHLMQPQGLGYSRILEIHPLNRNVLWQYQGSEKEPFYSSIQGKHEETSNGNILVVETEGGRIFEIHKPTNEIVWEYVNLVEKGFVGRITQAIPYTWEYLSFL